MDDAESILNLTKDEDLYSGMDYLAFVLNNWISESSSPGSLRENFVLMEGKKLIGFTSVYFQNLCLVDLSTLGVICLRPATWTIVCQYKNGGAT